MSLFTRLPWYEVPLRTQNLQPPPVAHLAALLTDPAHHPPDGEVVATPDVWMCRHPLPLAQLNAVRMAARPGGGWPQRVADVVGWMGSGRIRWDVAGSDPELEAALAAAGFVSFSAAVPMWLDLATARYEHPPSPPREVHSTPALAAWYHTFCASRGLPTPVAHGWEAFLGPARANRFFVAGDGQGPAAGGALLVDRARGVGLLWGGGTRPDARGGGAYRTVLAARIAAAREEGLEWLVTRAIPDRTAPPLERSGFRAFGAPVVEWERPTQPTGGEHG